MSYDRNKVIQIARNEIGYLEKSKAAYLKNPAILDQKTAGAGYDNYTKYGRDMHKIYPSVMDFPAAWCDCFVDWCFYRAYGIATAKSLLGGNFDDYTVASAQMYQKHGALDHTPEVGAQIFFTKNGQVSGCYHTGIVESVSADKKTVTTIEGNTSATGAGIVANGGCVARKIRTVNNNTIFGHPRYQDEYGKEKSSSKQKDIDTIAKEVIAGKWGHGAVREVLLKQAGYNYQEVQAKVNTLLKQKTKTISEVAKEVIDGKWGSGITRQQKLEAAGYSYNEVQNEVNKILNKKSIEDIAREVIAGKWGSGNDRKNRLTAAGYNYNEIQNEVNRILAH